MAQGRRPIIPPREPFVDMRTGTISRAWFLWLTAAMDSMDDAEATAMWDSVWGVAANAQLSQEISEVRLFATIPIAQDVPDTETARLIASIPQSQLDQSAEIEAARLERIAANASELEKRVDAMELLSSVPQATVEVSAAKLSARAHLRC